MKRCVEMVSAVFIGKRCASSISARDRFAELPGHTTLIKVNNASSEHDLLRKSYAPSGAAGPKASTHNDPASSGGFFRFMMTYEQAALYGCNECNECNEASYIIQPRWLQESSTYPHYNYTGNKLLFIPRRSTIECVFLENLRFCFLLPDNCPL